MLISRLMFDALGTRINIVVEGTERHSKMGGKKSELDEVNLRSKRNVLEGNRGEFAGAFFISNLEQ